MRAGIYGRLSVVRAKDNDRDHEAPIPRQLKDCFKWVRDQDGEVVRTYEDPGISGYSGAHRPDFERLLKDVEDRVIDTVVCWKLDRLCRNHKDFERLWEACEARGARLVSLHEMFDSKTPAGEFTIRLMVGMAKMESDNISLRVSRAMEAVRAAGRPHTGGARHFGYRDGGEVERAEAAHIRWAAKQILAGGSINAVTLELVRRGAAGTKGKPIARRDVKRLLTSPRVAGLVEYQGEIVGKGRWKPLLDRPTWERLRAILNDPARQIPGRPPRYLLVGLLRCGVDGRKLISRPNRRITCQHPGSYGKCRDASHDPCRAAKKHDWMDAAGAEAERRTCRRCGAVVETWPGYCCAPDAGEAHLYVTAGPVEELVVERVLDRLDHQGLAAVLAARTKADDSRELAEQLTRDETALLELGDDYYQRGTIGKPEFLRQRAALEPRITQARAELARRAQQQEIAGLPGMPGALRRAWPSLTLGQRRAVLRLVLDRVVIMPASRPRRTLDPERVVIPPEAWKDERA
jgi:site-specific DNA recombinase